MPAGTYDVTLTGGSVNIGSVLPSMPLNSGTTFSVVLGTTSVSQPIGLTTTDSAIAGAITGNVTTTVKGAGVTIDPTTGSATVDASFFVSMTADGLGSCTLGSSDSPVSVHLTTDKGSAWDATTGAFSMVDNTFALPAPVCTPSLIQGFVSTFIGNLGSGNNTISLDGIATRRPDPAPTGNTPPPAGTSSPPPASSEPPATPNEITPLANAPATAKACVVPKLVGKTLKQAKRALKKAGCKVGKAKKSKSKKKKGRIVKQRYKVGTKLPAGAKVPLTVSKGPNKARKHRSR
jgi:PASTA domain